MTVLPHPGADRRRAELVNTALDPLRDAGIEFEQDGDQVKVAGFTFHPINGFWRADDGTARGYGGRSLVNAINSRKAESAA